MTDMNRDVLEQATDALREERVPAGPSPELIASVERLDSTVPAAVTNRKTLQIASYAATAAAVILLLTAGVIWTALTTPLAFADVVEKIKEAKSVTFVVRQQLGSQPEFTTQMSMQGDVLRYEMPDSRVLILDAVQGKGLMLNPKEKLAEEIDLKGQIPGDQLVNPIEQLRRIRPDDVRPLRDEVKDGRKYPVYLIRQAELMGSKGDWEVWVDPDAGLPVRIEGVGTKATLVFEDFTWNAMLDPEQFKLEVPEGYSLAR